MRLWPLLMSTINTEVDSEADNFNRFFSIPEFRFNIYDTSILTNTHTAEQITAIDLIICLSSGNQANTKVWGYVSGRPEFWIKTISTKALLS